MASEAFFPFRDNVDLAKKIGVSAIIQPGGSINDEKIIKVANQHKLSMCFSYTRVFKHYYGFEAFNHRLWWKRTCDIMDNI